MGAATRWADGKGCCEMSEGCYQKGLALKCELWQSCVRYMHFKIREKRKTSSLIS